VSPHFARQVVVSGYRTPNLTFNTLSTREMSSGGTLGARSWGVLGCRPDTALLIKRGVTCYLYLNQLNEAKKCK